MATHFSVGVVDDAVLVVSGEQLQAALLDRLHLTKARMGEDDKRGQCSIIWSNEEGFARRVNPQK